jgi:hypothetical protein
MNRIVHKLVVVATLLVGMAAGGCRDKHPGDEGDGVASSKPSGQQPKIVAPELSFSFGKVKEGTEVEHVFKIRNEGSAALVIERAQGS